MSAVSKARRDGSHLVACLVSEYDHLFAEKIANLKKLLNWSKEVDAFESPKTNFRMRANFQMWHDNPANKTPAGFFYAMYDENDKGVPYEVKSFPRGTKMINDLMDSFMKVFAEYKVIFDNLFEVRFVTTQSQQAVVTLLYKKPLHNDWHKTAEEVASKLNVKIVGRSRKVVQIAGGSDTITEVLNVQGRSFQLYQTEGAFSQPNAAVCEKMIGWALDMTKGSQDHDLLELYCGGGTFTAPLSYNFRKVLATEISKASVDLAHKAFALNGITNISIARLSSEEFSEAYSSKRVFKRLEDSKISLKDFNIGTVFVDPPRAGLDNDTCKMISQFNNIVYISCNPVTLARDVEKLKETHDVLRVAAFDQFPYTHHLEGGVYLKRRSIAESGGSSTVIEDGETITKKQKSEQL